MSTLLKYKTKIVVLGVVVFVLLVTAASAQNGSQKQLVFSGVITEAQCREFPSADFDIEPSGDRSNSKDLLNIRCGLTGHSPLALTLTFTIDLDGPSGPRSVRGEVFSFRWGKSMNGTSPAFTGQFTHDPDLCSRLAGLLNSRVLKLMPETSARVHQIPDLSSSCNGDDFWGTSMEIVLTADYSDSMN